MTLRALVFDVDGTLADTEETHRQAFNGAFLRFGLAWEWTRPLYRELLQVSGGKERIAHYIGILPVAAAERARLLELVPALHRAKTELYAELIADRRCPLRPGVARLLREAQADGLLLAVASTTTAANVAALLASQLAVNGLREFDTLACGDIVARKKPAPDIYLRALSTLGVAAGECVAFEDSANGVRAAKAAGLYTVLTPSPWTVGDDAAGADFELPHLGDDRHRLPPETAAILGAPWLSLGRLRELHAAEGARAADAVASAPR